MKQTIIVTGGAGFIGSHVSLYLARAKYNVIVLDTFVHNQIVSLPWATVHNANYGDESFLQQLFTQHNVLAIMHCGAFIEVGQSMRDPGAYYENNVAKTITLMRAAVRHGIRTIVFSSSCAVYGIPEHVPLSEEHKKNPISPYGQTKLMVENILHDFHKAYGLNYVNLRYFNAAGAWPEEGLFEQHNPETHLLPLVLEAALKNRTFTIFGSDYETKDGTAIRDYVHVRDIAQAHLLALEHLLAGHPSDSFNLGTGNGVSIKEMIVTIEQMCATKLQIVYGPRRAGDPAVLVADPTKAYNILHWQPEYSHLSFIVQSTLGALPMKICAQQAHI